jgi:transglutaminase-like putative cysteine protease
MLRISVLLDILTYCIALLGYAPLAPFLEAVPQFVFPAALIGGLVADRKGFRLRDPIPTLISILFFVFYIAQANRQNLISPAINLLIVLLSVRLVSEKKTRHYLQIFALALFSLAGSTLFTLDLLFLVYLFLLLALIAVALVILTFHATDSNLTISREGMKTLLSVAFLMPAGSLPLICVFFLILPRTQYPLWNFLNVSESRATGFSEKVQPGVASSIGAAKSPAFRASCEKLPKEQLYWRGVVLNSLAGNTWVRGVLPAGESGSIDNGRAVRQIIYPEPGRSGYLFALNLPVRVSGIRASLTGDFVLKTATTLGKRLKYEVMSIPGYTIGMRKDIDRGYYMRLSGSLSPRLVAAAREIAKKGKNDAEKLDQLKEFYISRNIIYATTELPVSNDPLDEFLFVKKRGNCEFFASSFAVMLRLAGVPSRLVGGYYGGVYNELGGYYLITEDMAHVWVEAYLAGKGWVMFDPSTLSANFQKAGESTHEGLGFRLKMYLDSCDYFWNMAVITYDLEKQFQIVNKINLRIKRVSWPLHPAKTLLLLGGPFIFLILVVAAARRMRASREEKILRQFLRQAKRKYPIALLPSTGLHELASLSNDPLIKEFVTIYGRAVYSDRKLTIEEYRTLRELLRSLA